MKMLGKSKNFFVSLKLPYKIMLLLSITLIVAGVVLVGLSLRKEVLDDKYIINEVTENITKGVEELSPGEMRATKSTEYMGKGIYKVTYSNYYNNKDIKNLLADGSYFSIIDIIGKGYQLDTERIYINEDNYKFVSESINSKEGIVFEVEEGIIYIDIPKGIVEQQNVIEIYIELVGRDTHFEYVTSTDTYFNLIPSMDNDFYSKKTSQSYFIEGVGYIILKEK